MLPLVVLTVTLGPLTEFKCTSPPLESTSTYPPVTFCRVTGPLTVMTRRWALLRSRTSIAAVSLRKEMSALRPRFLGGGSGHGQQDKASRRRGHVPNSCAHASLPTLRPSPLRARWKPSRRERPSAHRRSSNARAPPHRRGRHLPPFWRRECKR